MIKKELSAFYKKAVNMLKKRLGIGSTRTGYRGIKWHDKHDGFHISEHTGKLDGIHSLSTSCLDNDNCYKRRNIPGSICEKCFSVSTQDRYTSLQKHLVRNGELLTSKVWEEEDFPLLNDIISRIESFGDLHDGEKGITQARNYIRYIRHNPLTTFAWWSKNLGLINTALKLEGYDVSKGEKPSNVIFIVSALYENKGFGIDKWKKIFPWVDKEFIVLDPLFVLDNPEYESKINCGARQCMTCRVCYSHNDIDTIYELEK